MVIIKVICKMIMSYDKTVKPYPKLYWREHKNPYCQHEFDVEKKGFGKSRVVINDGIITSSKTCNK